MVRVTQLTKVQRPGCELGFFGMEQIPLPPHQATAGHRVTTDEPQSKISSHRVCPPGPSCFISHRKAMCNSGLSTIHHIYGALWGASSWWPCYTRGSVFGSEHLLERGRLLILHQSFTGLPRHWGGSGLCSWGTLRLHIGWPGFCAPHPHPNQRVERKTRAQDVLDGIG